MGDTGARGLVGGMKGRAILFPASNNLPELIIQEGAECGRDRQVRKGFRSVHGWSAAGWGIP